MSIHFYTFVIGPITCYKKHKILMKTYNLFSLTYKIFKKKSQYNVYLKEPQNPIFDLRKIREKRRTKSECLTRVLSD